MKFIVQKCLEVVFLLIYRSLETNLTIKEVSQKLMTIFIGLTLSMASVKVIQVLGLLSTLRVKFPLKQ